MGFKRYMPIVTILLSKASKDLIDGKTVQVSCHLLFEDGYSPLLLSPSPLFITYANAVISTLKPAAYVVIENRLAFKQINNGVVGANCLAAAVVSKRRKTHVIGRRYTIESGKVILLDEEPVQLSDPFDISLRLKELYNELPVADKSHPNFKKLVSAVSSFAELTKTPYSKVIKQSLH